MLRGSVPLSQLSPERAGRSFLKQLKMLELTLPPRMLLQSGLYDISNKQPKLFQIPKPLKHMKRELKPEEHKEIVSAVAAGDRIKAMNIYLSATEGNLTEAQNYLRTVTAKAELAESQRS
jgi:hypothetical protein